MQTSKSKASPIEVPSKSSPKTPRTAWKNKTPGSGSEQFLSSPSKGNRVNKERSPKVSRSPVFEKKRETKASDLESKIVQLKDELKQARDKMVSTELLKEQAELEAEESKKQLSDMTIKLEDTEKKLIEISSKVSHDNDTLLESELKAEHKQKSQDSGDQINPADSAFDELRNLQTEYEKAIAMVEKLKAELGECKKSEAKVVEELTNTRSEMDAVMNENRTLKLDSCITFVDTSPLASDLEESNAKVNALEMLVSKLQSSLVSCADDTQHCQENGANEEMEQLKSEILNLKYEDCKLRAALEAAEMRYQEVRLQSTLEIRSAYEQAENTNSILRSKESELQKANSDIAELEMKLSDHEMRLQTYAEKDSEKDQKTQLEICVTALQEKLLQKETLLQETETENESLKQRLTELGYDNPLEAGVAEQNSKRTARVIEQLEATQAANTELESELRKLKVQSDQWRKAAEAAAAMLTSGNNNGKYIDRTGSLDSGYNTLGGRISSPFSDDLNDDALKKKNGNMLKKIGVLWKKGQNQK